MASVMSLNGVNAMPLYFFRQDHSGTELRKLARQEDGRVCQRILMIANMLDGMEPEAAARAVGLGRQAAYDWHNRYEEEGIAGLRDRPRPGRRPAVDAETARALTERIEGGAELDHDGVISFRGVDAQRLLEEDHQIKVSLSAVYRLLHAQGLSWLAPRPRHPRSDTAAQDEFRKLSEHNLTESGWRRRTAGESKCGSPTKPVSARGTP